MMLAVSVLLSVGGISAYTADVKIVGMGVTQSLPTSYVRTFGRWSVDGRYDGDEGGTIARLHTEGDETFVDPTSTSELWWPSDIRSLQVRPAFDVLLRGGVPSYAMAGLNVRVPPTASKDSSEWRNYGLCSQPLASQWMPFGMAVDPDFRIECFFGKRKEKVVGGENSDDNGNGDVEEDMENGAKEELTWERFSPSSLGALDDTPTAHTMFAVERTRTAVEALGVFLSGIGDDSPLSDGFHVVSFPLTNEWIDLPHLPESEEKLEGASGYRIACVATAESDAEALMSVDAGLLEMTATSVLDIDVWRTASGSKSDYLPDSYKPLYVK